MIFRTDLALEERENLSEPLNGVQQEEKKIEECKITRIKILSEQGAKQLNKPIGTYITIELPSISDHIDGDDRYMKITAEELKTLLPNEGLVLVCCLGNRNITPDALGPHTADFVLATRHISGELARVTGLSGMRPVAVAAPGVLGTTGFEVAEFLLGLTGYLKPKAVIAVDALASRNIGRLGCTVQLSDSGISPGAGIKNARPQINEQTLGIPVIGVGVPTVVDAVTMARDLIGKTDTDNNDIPMLEKAQMIVTPREIDLLISRASRLLAMAINLSLNPQFSVEELNALIL